MRIFYVNSLRKYLGGESLYCWKKFLFEFVIFVRDLLDVEITYNLASFHSNINAWFKSIFIFPEISLFHCIIQVAHLWLLMNGKERCAISHGLKCILLMNVSVLWISRNIFYDVGKFSPGNFFFHDFLKLFNKNFKHPPLDRDFWFTTPFFLLGQFFFHGILGF